MKPIKENYFIKKEGVNFDPSIESLVGEDEKILWKGKPYRKRFSGKENLTGNPSF